VKIISLILLLLASDCFGQAFMSNRRKAFQPVAVGGSGTIGPVSIAADADDGEIWSTFIWSTGEDDNGVGKIYYSGANYVWCYYRFVLPSAIPSGATITSATMDLWGEGSSSWSNGSDDLKIRCSDSANASAPASAGARPSLDGGSQATTTATVDWLNVTWTLNDWNTTPSLVSMIQELVDDNGGLASGAGIVLWVAGDSNHEVHTQLREFVGEDNVAKLTISYE
jgi:hypothetical protein